MERGRLERAPEGKAHRLTPRLDLLQQSLPPAVDARKATGATGASAAGGAGGAGGADAARPERLVRLALAIHKRVAEAGREAVRVEDLMRWLGRRWEGCDEEGGGGNVW